MLFRLSSGFTIVAPVLTIVLAALSTAASAQASLVPSRTLPNRLLVSYTEHAGPTVDTIAATPPSGTTLIAWYPHLRVAILQLADPLDTPAVTRQLTQQPDVLSVAQDRIVSAYAVDIRTQRDTPNTSTIPNASNLPDALYLSAEGWAVRAVGGFGARSGTPGPWDITEGAGVRLALLDSGIDAAHPDLAPNLGLNITEIDQSPQTGIPSPCDDGSPQDQQGHGTWTASLAAAALGSRTGLVAGVAPAATLLNIKVLERLPSSVLSSSDPTGCSAGQAGGLLSWVVHGIEDAINAHANIVSMSFGMLVDPASPDGAEASLLFNHVAHVATDAGIVLIAAAGNEGFDLGNRRLLELPAEAADVLAIVASTNPACAENLTPGVACAPGPVTRPYYSNFGTPLNALAAPGGSYPAGLNSASTPDASSGWITGACSSGRAGTHSGPPTDPGHSFGCFGLGHVAYVQAIGTSAAAPLAAGAAALLLAAHRDWSPAAIIAALRSSAAPSSALPIPQIDVATLLSSRRESAR